ncbi:MAG: TIGR04086 family membrane protein [Bacillota bacterium]|mgnify:CR=1 FL=1|jgi:putative membrane protein (TIGR04086 family)|nr:TIGR04086 family membrane protein [Bacillota bacterium]HOB43544.1 TIGR04086 family membrane protein [Bacillota bacterium]HOL52637.1 TIGR04086 family membrane protein [Bacillota bacterium]HOO31383.1 TIGR04086 family membrane protein [Bacillota bacterium]HPZ14476.1 TIGR04086 family membrane protein [Bacillota bacterium]
MRAGAPKRESDRAQIPIWKLVALGCGVCFLATLVLSAVGGILTTLFTFDPTTINNAVPVIGYLSGGIGGLWAGKRGGKNGGRNGLLIGVVYLSIVLLISAAVVREPMSLASVFTRGMSTIIVSTLGGIIGVNL